MAPQTKAVTNNADWWREAALTKDESDARSLAKVRRAYNNWRRSRGLATIPYQRLHDIQIGRITHPLMTRPVNYNDPFDVYRSVYDEENYKRVFMPWPERDEEAYKNMNIAPSDKNTRMGSPVKPAFPQTYKEFVDQQAKTAALVGKADIQVHPEDELGNIVTLMKGIRGKWNGLNYRVPKGFESDGVSTPSYLWPIISPPVDPKTIRAGIVHDWIYRHQPKKWSREDADNLFAEMCREDGLSGLQTTLAFAGLRMFGDKAWQENAERKVKMLAERKAARIAERLAAKSKEANLPKAASQIQSV